MVCSGAYLFVLTYALNEQDAELRLSRLDVLEESLTALNRAICGIKNTNRTAVNEKVFKQLVQRGEGHLLTDLRGLFILRVKEMSGLVHTVSAWKPGGIGFWVHLFLLLLLGIDSIQKNVGSLCWRIDNATHGARTNRSRGLGRSRR